MQLPIRKEFKDEQAFKSIKWTLFKQPKNHKDDDKANLDAAFALSKDLKQLYEIRNKFHRIYDTSNTTQEMKDRLLLWSNEAKKLDMECLNPFIKMLNKWVDKIATFAQTHVTNAATEGLNNLIRHMKRLSFGLPNFEHMRLRVLIKSD
jgi:transposase